MSHAIGRPSTASAAPAVSGDDTETAAFRRPSQDDADALFGEPGVFVDEPFTEDGQPDDLLADPLDDDLNERIARAAPRRLANRATFVLAALALLVVGFAAGAQVQKSYGTAPAGSGSVPNPAALASQFAGRGGQGFPGANASGQAGAGRGGITGTVKLVDGNTVYVETADGQTLIVKTSGTTTVAAPGALKDLTAGSSVTVVGQNANGTVTATSITKTK